MSASITLTPVLLRRHRNFSGEFQTIGQVGRPVFITPEPIQPHQRVERPIAAAEHRAPQELEGLVVQPHGHRARPDELIELAPVL